VEQFAGRVRTVFHCFANPPTDLRRVLAAGSIVSFTGILTFKNGESVRETLAATALGQFMLGNPTLRISLRFLPGQAM